MLRDVDIRKADLRDKPYKLFDEKGLYIEIRPNGSKWWRQKYRFAGKEKRISHGVYPEISLAEARDNRDDARRLLRQGIDPSEQRKSIKRGQEIVAKGSFESVASEWFEKQKSNWAKSTEKKRTALIKNDLLPWLGKRSVTELDTHDLLKVLQRIEDRGAIDTAHNARQVLNQIFRYAKQTRRISENPAIDLAGALRPRKAVHRPAITEPVGFGKLLVSMDNYQGTYTVRCLLKICPLLFQRPGSMIAMKWDEIDWSKSVWSIPAEIMKMRSAHVVPLCSQAIEVLRDIEPLTANRENVFPGQRNPKSHVSEATINNALRKLGYDTKTQQCAHGFRASARTMLDEQLNYRLDWIEQQLAHQVKDPLGRAYNRTQYLPQRAEMMQAWADYLDTLKAQALSPINVISASFS